jgi:hypothetical protein
LRVVNHEAARYTEFMTALERLRLVARSGAAAVRLGVRDPRSLFLSVRMSAWIILISVIAPLVPLSTIFRVTETRRRWNASALLPAEELARYVERVFHSGLAKDGTCWKRAAVLRRYLLLDGIETAVVFGVRREDDGKLAGHAWLEREGAPFLERDEPRYTVTFRYPAR